MDDETNAKKKKKNSSTLLTDERFKQLFTNPDFQVDKNSAEYTLLNPVISQLDKHKMKKLKVKADDEKEMREKVEIDHMEDEHYGLTNILTYIYIYIYTRVC